MKLALGLSVLLLGQATPALDLVLSGTAGFGGRCVRGERASVLVEIDNRGADREIDLALTWAADGARYQTAPSFHELQDRHGPLQKIHLSLGAKSRKIISVTLVTPDADRVSVWAFAQGSDGKTIAGSEILARLLPRNSRLIAIVGTDQPEGLARPDLETTRLRPTELPEDWRAYGALEALLWLDGRAADVRTPAQLDALRTWVSSGGHFIVAPSSPVGLEKGAITDILPVSIQGGRQVERLVSLGSIPNAPAAPQGQATLLGARVVRGKTLLEQDSLPILVDSRLDAGRVTFAAFDPSRPPFAGWAGAGSLWSWILRPAGRIAKGDEDPPPRLVGSAPLIQAAASFPDIEGPAIGGLIVLIGLFVLAVGPADYIVLRLLRRLELTWFTFPAIVLAFTVLILFVGGAFVRHATLQREIAVVDHYVDSSFCRRLAVGAVLSPSDVQYSFSDATPLSSNFLARNLSRDYSDSMTDIQIEPGPPSKGSRWNLLRGATGILMTDRCSTERSPLEFRIASETKNSIEAEFKNDCGFQVDEAVLVTRAGVYRFQTISRGQSRAVGTRTFESAPAYASGAGSPLGLRRPRRRYDDGTETSRGIPEGVLNQEARKLLVGLSFLPPPPQAGPEAPVGLARRIDASGWIEAGGSVLLTWHRSNETVVDVTPVPSRKSAYVMTRFFKGPTQ